MESERHKNMLSAQSEASEDMQQGDEGNNVAVDAGQNETFEPLWEGDAGDMCADARRAAIELKCRPYVSGSLFELVIDNKPAVERSLANDLLTLRLDLNRKIATAVPVKIEGIKSLKTTPKISALKAAFLATLRLIDLEFDGQETPRAARFVAVSAVCERMSLSDGPLSEVGSEQAREEKVKQLFKWAEGIKLVSASEGNKWRICEALAIAVDRTQASLWAQGSAEAESGLEQSTENETASESGI